MDPTTAKLPPETQPPPPPRKTTFSLYGMIVACLVIGGIFVLALLTAILLPTFTRARELAKRAVCQKNLNGIGKAMSLYYADNNNRFPMIRAEGDNPEIGLGWHGAPDSADNVYALRGTFPPDNLSLLVYKGMGNWNLFVCPSTGNEIKDRSPPSNTYGFGLGGVVGNLGKSFIDYGLHLPQHWLVGANQENKAWLGPATDPQLIIMADRPDTADTLDKFSSNHGNEGENILAWGGSVRWAHDQQGVAMPYKQEGIDTPYKNASGWGSNNIYRKDMTYVGGVSAVSPPGADPYTSVITTIDSPVDSVIYWRGN